MLAFAGCVGVPVLPNGDGGSGSGGDGGSGSGGDPPETTRAVLVVSNLTPSEGEEVALKCVVTPAPEEPLMFTFEPEDRLIVDEALGTATLIVQSTDLGTTLSIRCSATDADGLTFRSAVRNIMPSR